MKSSIVGLFVLGLIAACGGDDDAAPEDEILLPEDRCRAVGLASCENGGRCVSVGGTPQCSCTKGFTGPTCAECAPGEVCGGGACAGTKCTAHAACAEVDGKAVCSCAAGYQLEGEACVWRGVIADPTFQDQPAGAWARTDASLQPTAAAPKDPGLVELAAGCTANTSVKQTVTMPPWELAEPLALEITGAAHCQYDTEFGPVDTPCSEPVDLLFGARGSRPWSSLELVSNTTRKCLGDGYFGKTFDVSFHPSFCGSALSTTIDHAEIVPAPECPLPGQVPDGDFENGGGWKAEGTGTADVAPSVGNQSTRGGRLRKAFRCELPLLRGSISVPAAMPKPALAFTARGGANRRMRVLVENALVGTIVGTNVFENVVVCLPDFVRGQATSLAFAAPFDRGQPCGNGDDYEFVFDDVTVRSDASCPDAAPIVDGGFELPDDAKYWFADTDGSSVSFPKSGGKTGAGFLQLSTSCQRYAQAATSITVPPIGGGEGGPALVFSYRANGGNNLFYQSSFGALTPVADWTETKRCLPPRLSGGAFPLYFQVSAGNDCGGSSLSVDDVRVIHDTSCPAL